MWHTKKKKVDFSINLWLSFMSSFNYCINKKK